MDMQELHLDMDGVLVDLYSTDWRTAMAEEREDVFLDAQPLVNMDKLRDWLLDFRRTSGRVVINTHTPDGASKDYQERVRLAKCVWLLEHLGWDTFDRFVCTPYGTAKSAFVTTGCKDALLVDDSVANRLDFTAQGYKARSEQDLRDLF